MEGGETGRVIILIQTRSQLCYSHQNVTRERAAAVSLVQS